MKIKFDQHQKSILAAVLVLVSGSQFMGCTNSPKLAANKTAETSEDKNWDAYDTLIQRSIAVGNELALVVRPVVMEIVRSNEAHALEVLSKEFGHDVTMKEMEKMTAHEVAMAVNVLKADAMFAKAILEKITKEQLAEADLTLDKLNPIRTPETQVVTKTGDIIAIDTREYNAVHGIAAKNISEEADKATTDQLLTNVKKIHSATDSVIEQVGADGKLVKVHTGLLPVNDGTCAKVFGTIDTNGTKMIVKMEEHFVETIEACQAKLVAAKLPANVIKARLNKYTINNGPWVMQKFVKEDLHIVEASLANSRIKNLVTHCNIGGGPTGEAAVQWANERGNAWAPQFACNTK